MDITRMGLHRSVSDYINKEREKKGQGPLPVYQKFLVSSTTGGIGALLGCPMDVALVRMQADTIAAGAEKRGYTGIADALVQIVKSEGVLTLWRGSLPLVARGAAMNLGQMASYDVAKEQITTIRGSGTETNLLSAAVSGFFAAFTSLPFDMMKSRLMNMKPDPAGKLPYSGIIDCGVKVATREGVTRFWAGFWTYYARCAPTAMIQLMAIEQFTSAYKRQFLEGEQ